MATPFKSVAQMERCKRLVEEGKVSQESFDASLAATQLEGLPERLHPKKEKPKTEGAEETEETKAG